MKHLDTSKWDKAALPRRHPMVVVKYNLIFQYPPHHSITCATKPTAKTAHATKQGLIKWKFHSKNRK